MVVGILVTGNVMAEFKVGQVWEYKTRKGEESSLLYIVKIDKDEKIGNIYHIYLDGLRIKNPHTVSGIQEYLPHVPVDETTLKESVMNVSRSTMRLPDISEGYQTWKEAFDSGKGGVFNIPVNKVVEYIEDVVN